MDIFCPSCQKKIQIADTNAGQTVQCPACATTFQAPSLPSHGPLPTIEPLVPPPPKPAAQVSQPAAVPPGPETASAGEPFRHGLTLRVRKDVVSLVAPIGMALLFVLSFFPWQYSIPASLSLWQLAFTKAGFIVFLFYVLLVIVATPFVFLQPLLERNLFPAPPQVRPFLPWLPTLCAFLNVAALLLFLAHYFNCTFLDTPDPATLWMKLAFRLHTLVVAAALLDIWLARRQRWEMREPVIDVRW